MTNNVEVTTPSDLEVKVVRSFNAPRDLVFKAWTEPALLMQWMHGPDGWKMDLCESDLSAGGRYRLGWAGPDGATMRMGGIYREVLPPERLVSTEKFDDAWYPGEALVETVFTEEHGRTTTTMTIRYESKEARDAAVATGMTEGMAVTYAALDEYLAMEISK